MTMNSVYRKLRSYNKKNYTQFVFCITLSVILITSYAVMLFSPVVQNTLPEGGDSKKQVLMIFVLALIGCLVFTVYATGLFLKYKSKETGVFLALGAKKEQLKKALYTEIITILAGCFIVGIILGSLFSYFIWQVFRGFLINGSNMLFVFEPLGYGTGILFSLAVGICTGVMASQFMKRTNLMDILNENRKIEPLVEVSKKYGLLSVLLIIGGVVLGNGAPLVMASLGIRMPGLWSLVYLISIVGVYMFLVYVITHHEKGRNPQRYYRKIIPFSMMKFQGRQTVRNMLIVTILIVCSLFACFYPPQLYTAALAYKDSPTDYVIPYRKTAPGITEGEIKALADKHKVIITKYNEYEFVELIGSGIDRDWDDEGKLIEKQYDEYLYFDFLSQSQYEEITGSKIDLQENGYYIIIEPNSAEGFWSAYDDLSIVTNPVTGEHLLVNYQGALEYKPLVSNKGNKYVLSDSALEKLSKQLTDENKMVEILFNVKDLEGSYDFSRELYELVLERASEDMAVMKAYDKKGKEIYEQEGREYGYDEPMRLTSDNTDLMEYWKYYPAMKILVERSYFQNFAVFFLLFVFVAVICLIAVSIVSYTRSVTIGINNKRLFDDLMKLGANRHYILSCIKPQLSKIFFVPGFIGIVLMLGFTFLIFLGNDGIISPAEWWAIRTDLGIICAVIAYFGIIYQLSLSKIKKIIDLK